MTTRLKDLPEHLQLVTDSQDVQAVADWLGREIDGGCLFVEIDGGEYVQIWHCAHDVPWIEAEATCLLQPERTDCPSCARLAKRTRAAVYCRKGHRVYPEPTNATAAYARNPDPNDPNFERYLSWSRAGHPNAR